jgi:hypothetical protein
MRKAISWLVILAALALNALAADNALVGVWKLEPHRSHFSHGDLPLSLVITIEAAGADGIKYSSRNQLVDGSSGGASYEAKFDGKDYPVTGSPSYDHVSIRKVKARTFQIQMKKSGTVVVDATYTVTGDGKSLTRKGTASYNPSGANHFEEWFARQ